MTTMIIL